MLTSYSFDCFQVIFFVCIGSVIDAASQVISALRDARGKDSTSTKGKRGSTRKRIIKEEVSTLFNKRPKLVAWKHRFVCLGERKMRIPTTEAEKDRLFKAGLGEKTIEFDDMDSEAEDIRETLFNSFPKLRDAGGFVLCKCLSNSRNLVPLSQLHGPH